MSNLVAVNVGDVLVVDSRLVAAELEVDHSDWMQNVVYKYQAVVEQAFGILRFENGKIDGRGRPEKFAWLTEEQSTAFMTLSRNTDRVVQAKMSLVKAFSAAKAAIGSSFVADEFGKFGQYAEAVRLVKTAQFVDYDPIEFLKLHMQIQGQSQSSKPAQSTSVETRSKLNRRGKPQFTEVEIHESVEKWFHECVELSPDGSVQQGRDPGNSDQLFGHYYQWCMGRAIEPVSYPQFGVMFRAIVSSQCKVKPIKPQNKLTFRGLRLR